MRIELEKVCKRYGPASAGGAALDHIDLNIAPGEFVAITGTSGSGKTTLLNILGGLDRGFEGRALLDGQDIGKLSDVALSALRNQQVGFVFQHFHLLDHLTARENVALGSFFTPRGVAPQGPARAQDLLDRVGLGSRREDYPTGLSGGQKQRVAIARALYHRPRLLLCDEPTGSLDRTTGTHIMELFGALNAEEGITLVIITHEEYIARMARRVVRLEAGAIAEDSGPAHPQTSQGVA